MRAATLAVALGKAKLAQLLSPAKPAVRNAARLEIAKAVADLATLRRRGGPANGTDLALASLKVGAAQARSRSPTRRRRDSSFAHRRTEP